MSFEELHALAQTLIVGGEGEPVRLMTDGKTGIQRDFEDIVRTFGFHDPYALRVALAKSGAIISGSAALALYHPGTFQPNDLDFYVLAKGLPYLLLYVQQTGYSIIPFEDKEYDESYDSIALIYFQLMHVANDKVINIIVPMERHVITSLSSFHSTIVMNAITWCGVVSLYADWTLTGRGLIVTERGPHGKAVEKYKKRGFQLFKVPSEELNLSEIHEDVYSFQCPRRRRFLSDGDCTLETFDGLPAEVLLYEENITWVLPISCDHE